MQYARDNQEKRILKRIIKMLGVFSSTSLFFIILVSSIMLFFFGSKVTDDSMRINGSLSGVPQELIPYFNEASELIGLPNWVLAGVAKNESNFDVNCSYGGAYGIMQMQKVDLTNGEDLWAYYMNQGLGKVYKDLGYDFSSTEEMWNIFLNDPRVQIIAGAYELRNYTNYVLWRQKKVDKLNYLSKENLKLIDWSSDENDSDFRDTLRRVFACYNGGPGYGMSVDLDNAKFDYPNKVYKSSIEYRGNGLDFADGVYKGDNETIEKAIAVGSDLVGKTTYVFGGGRTPYDIAHRRFDCSSFIHWMFSEAGVNLGDYRYCVTDSLARQGKKVDPSEIKRGDILFFNTYKYNGHVGIYLGNGDFLHCGTSKGVWINSLNESYWKKVSNGNVRRIVE